MLSESEIKFLKGIKQVNQNYQRILNHRIMSKLHKLEENIPLLLNNPKTKTWFQRLVTEYSNVITKSRNNHLNEKNPDSAFFTDKKQRIWWAEPDLNQRSSPRQGDILTS